MKRKLAIVIAIMLIVESFSFSPVLADNSVSEDKSDVQTTTLNEEENPSEGSSGEKNEGAEQTQSGDERPDADSIVNTAEDAEKPAEAASEDLSESHTGESDGSISDNKKETEGTESAEIQDGLKNEPQDNNPDPNKPEDDKTSKEEVSDNTAAQTGTGKEQIKPDSILLNKEGSINENPNTASGNKVSGNSVAISVNNANSDDNSPSSNSAPFMQSSTVDGIKVTVSANEGVFPADAKLSVKKVSMATKKSVEEKVEEIRQEDVNVAVSYTFDIKVLDNKGNELQPSENDKVTVSFTTDEVADDNLQTDVYHVSDDGGEVEKLETEEKEDVASAETEGFSFYTVEFTYNNLQYVMPGDTSISLNAILKSVGLSGDVSAVECSDEELFSASNDGGEWIITAHQAFTSTEWMKVTINDVVYEITVTDAVSMTQSEYDNKVNGFISDSRWKHGISWTSSQRPKLSTWGAAGCYAYGCDFAKYMYGLNNVQNGTEFTNMNEVRTGDIVATSVHTVVILARDGNRLRTAEGAYSSKVRIGWDNYTLSNGKIVDRNTGTALGRGYHFVTLTAGTPENHDPEYAFDSVVSNSPGVITVSGWAYDPDDISAQLEIPVYAWENGGSYGCRIGTTTANKLRSDVNSVYNCGNYHGFVESFAVPYYGTVGVSIDVNNIGQGDTRYSKKKTCTVIKDTISPVISNVKVTNLSSSGYTVICDVYDNVELRGYVDFSTWTVNNGQDDKKVFNATVSNGKATCNISTSDHGNQIGCDYVTSIYVEDVQGNSSSTQVNTIVPAPISNASISPVSDATYTGKEIKPLPVVKYGATTLINGTDYTLSYKNNVNVGTATITVTGKGKYSGSKSTTFKINPVPVSGVKLNQTSANLQTGKTLTLKATVLPENATNKTVTWKSSNSNVASVSSSGVVTARNAGTAIITATTEDGKKTATCNVTVNSYPVSNTSTTKKEQYIKVNCDNTVKVGDTLQISVTGAQTPVSYVSSNPNIATVNSKGMVTGQKEGSVYIIITAAENANYKKAQYNMGLLVRSGDKVKAFVTRMYTVVLERQPDAEGLAYWTQQLKNGSETGASLMSLFFLGDELTNKHLSNRKYVQLAYQGALGRNPDAEGTAYWVDALDSGTSPQFLVCGCVASQEFNDMCASYGIKAGSISVSEERDKNLGVTKFVSRLYTKALGRNYDTSGLNYWCGIINANPSRDNVIQVAMDGCFHSEEFLNKNLSNRDFVTVAYRTFLGREADLEGYNYWLGQLAGGMSRDEMIRNCAYSQEFSNIMASYGL